MYISMLLSQFMICILNPPFGTRSANCQACILSLVYIWLQKGPKSLPPWFILLPAKTLWPWSLCSGNKSWRPWPLTFLSNSIFCFDPGSETLVNKPARCPSKFDLNKKVNRKVFAREMSRAANGDQRTRFISPGNSRKLVNQTKGHGLQSSSAMTDPDAILHGSIHLVISEPERLVGTFTPLRQQHKYPNSNLDNHPLQNNEKKSHHDRNNTFLSMHGIVSSFV